MSKVAQLMAMRADKEKNFRTALDVERLHYLLRIANIIRDYPGQAALAGAVNCEVAALSAKQIAQDVEEQSKQRREFAEAAAADQRAA